VINEKGQGPNSSASGFGNTAESYKTYMGALNLTAPTAWGWIGGSTFSVGVINGFNSGGDAGAGGGQTSVYAGATVNTPLSALKLGASFDYLHDRDESVAGIDGDTYDGALYASFQATEKLSLNLRGEFIDDGADALNFSSSADPAVFASDLGLSRAKIWAFTADAQYDLWKNVVSRVEFRWDHGDNGKFFGAASNSSVDSGAPTRKNAEMIAAQIIYKF
jgi:hypothetical protein